MSLLWLRGGEWELCSDNAEPELRLVSRDRAQYSVTDALADSILDELTQTASRLNPIARALAARDGRPPAEGVSEVARLVRSFGPLAVSAPPGGPSELLGPAFTRTVVVSDYIAEMKRLAWVWFEMAGRPTGQDRARIAGHILDDSAAALREVEVIPRFRADAFGYDVTPISLRARLWERIFVLFNANLRRLCRFCAEPFENQPRRGQPFEYCERHRGSRFRQAVTEGRAPAMALRHRFNHIEEE